MVTAGKVFRLRKETELRQISRRLENFKKGEVFERDGHELDLRSEISSCNLSKQGLSGVFAEDVVLNVNQHGRLIFVPKTRRVPFLFSSHGNRTLLAILEKKPVANSVANRFNKLLKIEDVEIVEGRIRPETLRRFHESNPGGTKIVFFEDIGVPNVEKLSLYGSNLANTSLYNDYCARGRMWYVVVTSKKYGNIVGITGDGVVTIFNKIEEKDYFSYVTEEIFPLIT